MSTDGFNQIKSAAAVNLQQHAVIEASAGTGKTYTLIELVMRLLLEERMTIDKLLLVTFTEQATGELKARIRQRLWEALDANKDEDTIDDALTAHLEHNLAQLNQASIFTIHGFCHGALKEFAFEQGAVFEAEVVNDYDVWPLMLRQMKRRWPADEALINELQAYTAEKSIASVDDLLLQLAGKFKPEFDSIYPTADTLNSTELLNTLQATDISSLSELEKELSLLKGSTDKTLKTRWQDKMAPFFSRLSEIKNSADAEQLQEFLSQIKLKVNEEHVIEKQFFSRLNKVYDSSKDGNEREYNLQVAPRLFLLLSQINQLLNDYATSVEGQKYQAIPALLKELMQSSQQYKLERGLISYDDMILRLWQQLLHEHQLPHVEQLLTQALRHKYQVAIIDEFQDTDIRQWQIFEQLFLKTSLTSSNSGLDHRLWVIGDPKQAIYGFRGADLHTYEAAKSSIIELYRGQAYRLGTNFRTVTGLITEMNRFFAAGVAGGGGWFVPEEVHVKPPSSDVINIKYTPQIIDNKHDINYFNCLSVDCADAETIKSQLAMKIATTIKQQIINQVEVSLKGKQRLLNASDVCILVRGNTDAEYIEAALKKQHIPFTFHKKKNLYQSIEAIHFQIVLTALARPNEITRVNNALLTLFFALQPAQLNDFAAEQLPATTELWLKTKAAVMAKDWIKVFELLLHESGALFRARNNSRRVANIKQLKQQLLKAALQNNLGADALLKYFQQKRQQTSGDEDLHHKDTERKAVKIMTMHISKGLEFPVVFLFGGFSQGPGDSFLQFYDEAQQGMVYDLVKKHQTAYAEQQLKEAHQLYYVAMTRAIFMLFLPYVDESEKKISKPGLYVNTVMARLKETGMYQQTPPELSAEIVAEMAAANNSIETTTTPPEFNLKVPSDLYSRRRNLHSFSSLSRLKSHASHGPVANDFSQSLTAELMTSEVRINPEAQSQMSPQTSPQIPGGIKTGHVLHGIFEHLDFNQVNLHESVAAVYQDQQIMAVIDQQMKLFKLDNKEFDQAETGGHQNHPIDYRQQLADWAWHTLKKPLLALGGKNLASITQANRCHELSFFWHHGPTHLTGFIDLFFAVPSNNNDAMNDSWTDYYILDWKSNYSANGYNPSVLSDQVMTQHQYHWQYQLYAMAIQSWFDALQLKKARLKGAIYVFSRGIDCHEGEQNGVYFDDFSEHKWQLDDIRDELLHIDQFGVKS